MAKRRLAGSGKFKSRRLDRAKRIDAERLWREGQIDEEATLLERWSRERKDAQPKVAGNKLEETELGLPREVCVIEVHRRSIKVLQKNGEVLSCRYGPNLDLSQIGHVSVGDKIKIADPLEGGESLMIEVLPRHNVLSRPGPEDRRHKEQVLAANVDLLVIVFTTQMPSFNPRLIDRYLVLAERCDIPVLLCCNKIDLDDTTLPEVEYLHNLGYDIHCCSAKSGTGMKGLQEILRDKAVVLSGSSGVGKSSLINYLDPAARARIGEVRAADGKGRHTTSVSRLYHIEGGIGIIDTPGIRELAISGINPHDLAFYFRDFRIFLGDCRFRDCLHKHESGCAIISAVKEEKIPAFRHQSYLRLLDTLNS